MSVPKAILIIGGSGFLGTHLALKLREGYKVYATYNKHPIRIPGVGVFPFDFSNENWMKRLIYTIKPDVVIFAAGKENVEWAQGHAKEAIAYHATSAGIVAKIAELFAPRFIYLSNCYTFDGNNGNFHETDILMPATALGKSKVNGENYIRGRCLNYVIIRSSPLYGRSNGVNPSFLDHLRMKLDRGERIELDHDTLHSFAPVDTFTDVIERTLNSGIKNRALHVGGLTRLTLYEFAREFAKKVGYEPEFILPKKMLSRSEGSPSTLNFEKYVWDYSLNSTLAVETLKIKPLLLEEGLDLIQQKAITSS